MAVGLALNVVHAHECNFLGVAPAVLYHAGRKELVAIDGLGVWPRAATPEFFRDRHGVGGIFRQIPVEILSAEKLGLSQPILDLCTLNKGLVLVTGPTGSGKSSTLAAMMRHLNETQALHVITLEDPVEYLFADRKSSFSQREVGIDVAGRERRVTYLRDVTRRGLPFPIIGEGDGLPAQAAHRSGKEARRG